MKTDYIFGIHSIMSVLEHTPDKITELLIVEQRHDKRLQNLIALAKKSEVRIHFVTTKELEHLVSHVTHQGVVAKITESQKYTEDDLEPLLHNLSKPALILILDEVQDPHNLGACMRVADAAGVDAVIVPKDRSAALTPIARKIASGAAETVPFIQVTNLARTLRFLKEEGIWLYGTSDDAKATLYDTDLRSPIALILGSEGKGLRRLTREHCDEMLSIPMAGTVSSLNVSVAAGVFLFETVRQRIYSAR